jgi:hypothetical protein
LRCGDKQFWLSESEERFVQDWIQLGEDDALQVAAVCARRGAFVDPVGNLGRLGEVIGETFSDRALTEGQLRVVEAVCALSPERGSIVYQAFITRTHDRGTALTKSNQTTTGDSVS